MKFKPLLLSAVLLRAPPCRARGRSAAQGAPIRRAGCRVAGPLYRDQRRFWLGQLRAKETRPCSFRATVTIRSEAALSAAPPATIGSYRTGCSGLEGDYAWSGIKGSSAVCGGTNECGTKLRSFGTARARIGPLLGSTLIYVTGGAAVGDIYAYDVMEPTANGRKMKWGWTAGGGVEQKLTRPGRSNSNISTSISEPPAISPSPTTRRNK